MESSSESVKTNRGLLPKFMAEWLITKFESFDCHDVHHGDCVLCSDVRDAVIAQFGNITDNELGKSVHQAFVKVTRKRKGKARKSVYCGVRKSVITLQEQQQQVAEMQQEIQEACMLNTIEKRKRKLAERVANNYYRDWQAERKEKQQILDKEMLPTSNWLPNACFIPTKLLNADEKGEIILGSGVFGTVKLHVYKSSVVAVKYLKNHLGQTSSDIKKTLFHEAKVLLNIKCCNAIPMLIGICVDEQPYKLVMQFYGIEDKSITLHSLLINISMSLSEEQWYSVLAIIVEGIHHVHMSGYLHNDIKTDNVVLYKTNDSYCPVLIDFGKSCKRNAGKIIKISKKEQDDYRTKYKHIAPEVIDGSNRQSIYSDIYSFGYMVKKIQIYILPSSEKLKRIIKECYMVEKWDCRASLSKVTMVLQSY